MDGTSLLCNEGELKVVGSKEKIRYKNNFSKSRFSITVLQVVSAAGVNGIVIFMVKGILVHPRLIGTNLVNIYVLSEGSCVITNKKTYTISYFQIDIDWEKVT